jgi:hypothetical protein
MDRSFATIINLQTFEHDFDSPPRVWLTDQAHRPPGTPFSELSFRGVSSLQVEYGFRSVFFHTCGRICAVFVDGVSSVSFSSCDSA